MNYEATESGALAVEDEPEDLRTRTTTFALRIVKLYSALPKSIEAQLGVVKS